MFYAFVCAIGTSLAHFGVQEFRSFVLLVENLSPTDDGQQKLDYVFTGLPILYGFKNRVSHLNELFTSDVFSNL